MHTTGYFTAFNTKAAIIKSRLLPAQTSLNSHPLACGNCKSINYTHYHFCTNCGYPVHPVENTVSAYNMRLRKTRAIEKSFQVKIVQARNTLYILAGTLMTGLFYIFSHKKTTVIQGAVMLVAAVIFISLGCWSRHKPLTALLISLMVLLTFAAINLWKQVMVRDDSFDIYYLIFIQGIFTYFLWRGVSAAFQADILEEEQQL